MRFDFVPTTKEQHEAYIQALREKLREGVGANEDFFRATIEAAGAAMNRFMGRAAPAPAPAPAPSPPSGGAYDSMKRLITNYFDPAVTPNPWFLWNGHCSEDSSTQYTQRYITRCRWAGIGEMALDAVGGMMTSATTVNVPGLAIHGRAASTSAQQLFRLESIARSFKDSVTIGQWLSVIRTLKGASFFSRQACVANAVDPLGASINGALFVGTTALTLNLTNVCLVTSADIHWQAFRELALKRVPRYGAGPALRILFELFGTKYEIDKFVVEPNGWMAVSEALITL
ncbi:MAG TPA: hypothetical protein VM580_09755 [Labilithrix sp.]|nr:hypothetical protein [Labilithrix sp.]